MNLSFYQGSIVILDFEQQNDTDQRRVLVRNISDWAKQNIVGDCETIFMRNGVQIHKEDFAFNMITTRESFYEKWLWIFEDPKDATLFKLTWGNV